MKILDSSTLASEQGGWAIARTGERYHYYHYGLSLCGDFRFSGATHPECDSFPSDYECQKCVMVAINLRIRKEGS